MTSTDLACGPVFVIGHGSSGTSILTRLLRNHLGIAFGTESQFLVRLHAQRSRFGDLNQVSNRRRLATCLLRERWFARCKEKFGFRTDAEQLLAECREPTLAGMFSAAFRLLAKHQGKPRWGDKTPEYARNLPVLESLFPAAQYIHIVRDGRDVALSMEGRFWGAKNIHTAALDWQLSVVRCDAFGRTLPGHRFLELRYEDLLTEPGRTFEGLVGFLGVPDDDGRLRAMLAEKLPQELNRDNFGKWKQRWSRDERVRFEALVGPLLARHGYETLPQVAPARRSAWSDLYWRVDNEARKLACRDYWLDNLYKLGLRSRGAVESIG